MLQLLVITPSGGEERFLLEHDEYILGRDPAVSIPLRDRKVSRHHARIFRQGNAYFIEDLGSVNGVLVDGVTIQSPKKLAPGIEIDVGGFILTAVAERADARLTFTFTGRTAPFAGQEFLLPEGELEVGRVDGNAIVIPDPSVSRNHALVLVSSSSASVQDLGSSNGTLVNGERVSTRTLGQGDVVSFGNVEFEFQMTGAVGVGAGNLLAQFSNSPRTIRLAIGLAAATTLILFLALALEIGPLGEAPRAPVGAKELDYEQSLDKSLKDAEFAVQSRDWEEAQKSFESVIAQDPINVAARDGLRYVGFNRQHASRIERARQALSQRMYRSALEEASRIPSVSAYAADAEDIAEDARTRLAKRLTDRASITCRKQDWMACHSAAVEASRLYPGVSEVVLSLIDQAEDAMTRKRVTFVSYSRLAPGTDVQLYRRYQEQALRDAVMHYIAGDLEAALRRLDERNETVVDESDSSELSTAIESIQREQHAATLADEQGNTRSAIRHWERALEIDSEIVPANQVSSTRADLAKKAGTELFKLGESAFKRGMYSDAFQYWSRGERIDDTNAHIQSGLNRLDKYAERVLADLSGKSAANCAMIREVLSTTRQSSSLRSKARASVEEFGCQF